MTQLEEKIETKENILKVALELFSSYGFEGTSVRHIAEEAKVNVAAVNYHFKSKHNLYWAVMTRSNNILKQEISEQAKSAKSLEELMVGIFDFVIEDPALFRTSIKMMLTDGVPDPDPEYYDISCENGPPGMEYVAAFLVKDIQQPISKKDLEWAVRSIFGAWFHWCTICSTTKMTLLTKNKKAPLSIEEIRDEIRQTTTAIKNYLISKSQNSM